MSTPWTNHIRGVKSETSSREYVVSEWAPGGIPTGLWGCSCPGWKGHGGECKHLVAMGKQSCRRKGQPMPKGLGTSDNTTFTDAAYTHYDTSTGFGSWEEWVRMAEGRAHGRDRYRKKTYEPRTFYDRKMADMKLLLLETMPETVKGLVSAMRKQARILHPDMGGDAEQFKEMFAAYERLLRYYPKEG